MPWPKCAPSVARMNSPAVLRLGAGAAIAGAAAQLIATVLEPDWAGDAGEAVRVVSGSGIWVADRVLDLIGVFLTIAALTIAGRMLAGGGREWVLIGSPFLILMGALGGSAILTGALMKDMAQQWERADDVAQQSYLAAFEAMRLTTGGLFFGAFLSLGIYLAALAPAILQGETFPHWLGWACAASASLVLGGNLLSIVSEPAFFAVLAGLALFLVVVAALGVAMWRRASSYGVAAARNPLSAAEQS